MNVKMGPQWNELILSTDADAILVPLDIYPFFMQGSTLLNKVREGVVILDDANTVVWSNKQFQEWFFTTGQPTQQQDFLNFLGSPVFLGKSHEEWNPITATRKTHAHSHSEFRLDDGRYFEIEVDPYEISDDKQRYLLVFLRDITQRKRQDNKLISLHNADLEINQMPASEVLELDPEQRMDLVKDNILYTAHSLLEYEMLELRTYDPATRNLNLFLQYGMTPEAQQREVTVGEKNGGINGWVAENRTSYLCMDCSQDPHYLPGGIDARSSLTLPIQLHDELLGVLNVESTSVRAFNEMDIRFMEIFVRGIAVTLNTLRLLDEEKQNTLQTSVEEIHGKVALPIGNILGAAIQMSDLLQQKSVESCKPEIQLQLHKIIKNAQKTKQVILDIGKALTIGLATKAEEESEEDLQGKRVLLVDSDEEILQQGHELLSRHGYYVDIAQEGSHALGLVQLALNENRPYYAILTPIEKIPGFKSCTQFIMRMGSLYGRKHPPFVLLQQIGMYNPEHTVVNTKIRYPGSQLTGKPFTEAVLLEAIRRAAQNASVMEPNFDVPLQQSLSS
ncbi:MAG: GAF domain-containing protein [Planctomycetia bacterium]|nr:GAF domain-containing protein [Planctomycetia bacterium]